MGPPCTSYFTTKWAPRVVFGFCLLLQQIHQLQILVLVFLFFSKGQMKNYQLRAVYCSYSQTFINIRPLLAEIMPQTLRIIFFHFCNRQVNVSNFRQDNVKHFVSCGNNNSSNPSNPQKDRTVNYQDFRGICSISIFNVL